MKAFLKSDFAYEMRPYFCLLVALYSFKKVQYPVPGVMFGVMLMFSAGVTLYLRASARGLIKSSK